CWGSPPHSCIAVEPFVSTVQIPNRRLKSRQSRRNLPGMVWNLKKRRKNLWINETREHGSGRPRSRPDGARGAAKQRTFRPAEAPDFAEFSRRNSLGVR